MCIRVHPWPKNQTPKADRTPEKTSDLATDGHGYTRMWSAGFLALEPGEKLEPNCMVMFWRNAILDQAAGRRAVVFQEVTGLFEAWSPASRVATRTRNDRKRVAGRLDGAEDQMET